MYLPHFYPEILDLIGKRILGDVKNGFKGCQNMVEFFDVVGLYLFYYPFQKHYENDILKIFEIYKNFIANDFESLNIDKQLKTLSLIQGL